MFLEIKEFMSFPVKTITDTTTIDEANEILQRYGHSALPVLEGGKLAGIISRRDVEKAFMHGFGKFHVKEYMTKDVITVSENASTEDILSIFAACNIGRVLVIKDGEITGIITRSDVISMLYNKLDLKGDNLKNKIDSMPLKVKNLLYSAGEIADGLGYSIYVVGGFVRDLILGKSTFDIDLVVVGDAHTFAKKFSKCHKGKVTKHEKFQTATVKLDDDFYIDVVTARKEYYEYPGALPTVERGTIKDDLFRRDFTVNSMAIRLNSGYFGELVDFYGGKKDIKNKQIRILYNLSFIEDPTRIIRAVRFEKRYGFKIEKRTEEFLKNAVFSNFLSRVSVERINHEVFAILKEKKPWEIVARMHELGILEKIYPEINYNNELINLFEKCFERINEFKNNLNTYKNIDKILLCLLVLYSNMKYDKITALMERMRLKKETRCEIKRFIKAKDTLKTVDIRNIDNYQAYNIFKNLSLECLYVLTLIFNNEDFYNKSLEYINKQKNIKLNITGNKLKEMGIEPGSRYKRILDEILKEKLNGNLETLEDEVEFVKKLLSEI